MQNRISKIVMEAITAEVANAIQVRLTAVDDIGNIVRTPFRSRVKVANQNDYDGTATNATLGIVSGSSAIDWAHTANKDITFKSETDNGYMDVVVTDSSVEPVTVYQGEPPLGGSGANVWESLELEFA